MADRHIAVIPARGGSKGIPRKNVRVVAGLPLVVHTIRAALESDVFDAVVLSTDDEEIAALGKAEGCTVVRRPVALAGDTAPTEPTMRHALREVEASGEDPFDWIWLLQPTSPLRNAEDIRSAAGALLASGADSVLSVCEDHAFMWESRRIGDTEPLVLAPRYDPANRPRRQDMRPQYRENGALYAVRRTIWDATGVRIGGTTIGYVMSADRSTDVDTIADIAIVEAIAEARTSGA